MTSAQSVPPPGLGGCGDCSVASNCLSVEPVETEFGRKRRINQSSCNQDLSCLDGFCPSFVTLDGAVRRKLKPATDDILAKAACLAEPTPHPLDAPRDILVTDVGGTGVITVGAVAAMAAHLQGLGASVLDFTGFAQKFGPVLSYLRLAPTPQALHQVRIDHGASDALIGCDLVVSTSPRASTTYRGGMRAVVNTAAMPTGDLVRHRDADLATARRLRQLQATLGTANVATVDANALAERELGDAIYANMIMLGMAWQAGLLPLSHAALMRAIELNGVEVEHNRHAFALGRLARAAPDALAPKSPSPAAETLDEVIARRAAFLAEYQDAAWAGRYRAAVERVRAADPEGRIADAVARSLFKLMSYKDEYEVARLHTDTGFAAKLRDAFEGDFRITHHLAPDFLPAAKDWRGRPRKRAFGPWVRVPMRLLAAMRRLRGTPFDPFGYAAERRRERALIAWYEGILEELPRLLPRCGTDALLPVAAAPLEIRGFGPVKQRAADEVQAKVLASLRNLRGMRMQGDLAKPTALSEAK